MTNEIETLIKQNEEICEKLMTCSELCLEAETEETTFDHIRNVIVSAMFALNFTTGYVAGLTEKEKKQ